eukprot:gene32016-40449_t
MLRKNVAFSRCTVVANEEEDFVPSHITEGAEFVLTEELVRLEVDREATNGVPEKDFKFNAALTVPELAFVVDPTEGWKPERLHQAGCAMRVCGAAESRWGEGGRAAPSCIALLSDWSDDVEWAVDDSKLPISFAQMLWGTRVLLFHVDVEAVDVSEMDGHAPFSMLAVDFLSGVQRCEVIFASPSGVELK